MICKICGKFIKSKNAESRHVKTHGYNTLVDYYVAHEGLIIPACRCGKPLKIRSGITFDKTCGDSKCKELERKKFRHSLEWKKSMSEKMKVMHKEKKKQ